MHRNPVTNWRYSGQGLSCVKWTTGRANVGNQASHGNSASRINENIKTWNMIKVGTWNLRGLVKIGKLVEIKKSWIPHCCTD